MGRWLRQYNVYRFLGLLPVLIVAVMWLFNIPMPIQWQGEALPHEPLLVVLGIVGTLLTYFFPRLGETSSGSAAPASTQSPADRNRADLLEAVDQIWLKGLLDNLLNQEEDFQIKLAFLEPEKVAQQYGGEPYPLKDNRAVLQTFEDFGRRLVLLGEPGAGKTVLLLQLARQLHQIALDNKTAGIPVIFPLSSWAQKQLPFHEWLRGELRDRYGASKSLAENLVAGERLIYLLDGLDEVNADQREACLKAIKTFVEAPNRRIEYMLCSRRAEFMALETRLDVPGEIVLQPLSWEAIQHYTQGDEFTALRTLLNENAILREDFAHIPFMLNTMAYVTQGNSVDEVRLAVRAKTDAESLRTYFLDTYVTKRLRQKSNTKYLADKTRHWLSWLARQLVREDQTDFYLENMQPWWLDPLTTEAKERRHTNPIEMVDGLTVNFAPVTKKHLLLVGLLGLLAWAITLGRLGRLKSETTMRYRICPGQGIQLSLQYGLWVGLGGLLGGLLVGLIGLLEGLILMAISLAQQLSLLVGLLVGLVGLLVGLLGGLRLGWDYGLGAFIHHYTLRHRLANKGHLPRWRYDKFLDYAAQDLLILRKVGGGYRFTHDYLRQHLAASPPTHSQG